MEETYPTIITLNESRHGVLTPERPKNLRELSGLQIEVTPTIDAESSLQVSH